MQRETFHFAGAFCIGAQGEMGFSPECLMLGLLKEATVLLSGVRGKEGMLYFLGLEKSLIGYVFLKYL